MTRILEARNVSKMLANRQKLETEKTLRDRKIDIRIKVDREKQELNKYTENNKQRVCDALDGLLISKRKELEEYEIIIVGS